MDEKKNKWINHLSFVAAFVVAFVIVRFFITDMFPATSQVTDAMLMETASEINTSLPIMIDEETQLDNVVAAEGELRYKYTLVNFELDELDVDILKEAVEEPQMARSLHNSRNQGTYR